MQDDDTANMHWDVAHAIEMMSEIMTLHPGDLLAMGTPSGVGAGRTPQLWMKPGDTVEITLEGIGVLSNPIEDEPARRTRG
jgi:2-keto-4-pentenoate hydratase/2-oxohepta-3-ene-1,7-dioic acid hydratase in catechol pathway